MTYYKFTNAYGRGPYSGYEYPIGEWITVEGPLEMCVNGWHYCTIEHALGWADARCHEVEVRGEIIHGDDKSCAQSIRLAPANPYWNERTQRLLAADFAERVLPIFEEAVPGDDRPRLVIQVTRDFADGKNTAEQLSEATRAAWLAVPAWEARAARAAWAAGAALSARAARASEAARAALAARAVWAAREDERRWQTARLAQLLAGEIYQEGNQNV